jgi:hypothetical protein
MMHIGDTQMAAAETVAWAKPPEPIRRLDYLRMQAPCIPAYGQLPILHPYGHKDHVRGLGCRKATLADFDRRGRS